MLCAEVALLQNLWSPAGRPLQIIGRTGAGVLPASLANVETLVVLDVENNQLGGTLNDFAFEAAANRADLHSALRYFDIGNNSFAGVHSGFFV